MQDELLQLINRERTSALVPDARLTSAAQRHSEEMAWRDALDHASADGRSAFDRMRAAGYAFRAAAENIASGNPTAQGTFAQWLHSEGHRLNMVNALYTHAGIGHAVAPSGTHYWTLDLATQA